MSIARARFALLLFLLPGLPAARAESVLETRARLDAEGRTAYEHKDYAGFLAASRKLFEISPASLRARYNLACGEALAGHSEAAVGLLAALPVMGASMDLAGDADLASLKGRPDFDAVMHAMAALEQHVGKSRVAFRLPERDLITEGIAYDPKSGDFFVSSVHKRKVLRVTPDGRSSDFLKAGQDGLLGVTGLWVDSARRALWLSTAWAPMVADLRPEEKDTSFLMEYDLGSGKLRRKLAPPSGVSGANLSDFGVGPDGTLIVSDPFSGRMYVLPPRAEGLQVLVEKGILASPQGVAWSPDGSAVFVADYSQGIARIDPKTGAVALLPAPADTALSGIDGLVWARGSLVGIQNGVTPHKLLRLELAPDASRITRASVLERSNPEFEEPTLAVVAGSDLFYVAASQYSRVRKDGSLDLDKMKPPVVLRLPIDW